MGNRQQLIVNGVTANTYSYDADDRLGSDQYDANGNTISFAGIANSYDFENHMVQKGAVTIAYDGDGNRVAETVAGGTTKYLVDTQNSTGYAQVVDELQNGPVTRTYSYGLERISETQSSGTSFYGYDGHGSVRFLTNSAGAVTDTYDYDAFGNLINETGSTANNYLFAGEQFDPTLNLYFNRARYLNTTTGRFWSMDPYQGDKWAPLSLHRYAYTGNNPVNAADRSGMQADIGELGAEEAVSEVEDAMPAAQAEPLLEAFEAPQEAAEAPQTFTAFQKGVAFLLIGTAALGTAIGTGGTGNQVPIDQEVAEASQGNYDIYRFGNSTRLYDLKAGQDYILNARGLIDPQDPATNPDYRGASAFRNPWRSGLTGYPYRISLQAIYDANGLGVIADPQKFPDVPAAAVHHTIYPIEEMSFQDFDERIRSLPWVITPPRIK